MKAGGHVNPKQLSRRLAGPATKNRSRYPLAQIIRIDSTHIRRPPPGQQLESDFPAPVNPCSIQPGRVRL